jgi:hypothetical protein
MTLRYKSTFYFCKSLFSGFFIYIKSAKSRNEIAPYYGVKHSHITKQYAAKPRSESPPKSEVKGYVSLPRQVRVRNRYDRTVARWSLGAIEAKLGNKQIEEAATNLLKLKEKVDVDKMREPSFLLILTGGQYAFRRKDGVLVAPIGYLKD